MRIVISAGGTRGDVQPMIALGRALQAKGHRVKLAAGSNFKSWIESYGLEAYPTLNMEALMQSEDGVKWVEARSGSEQMKYMKRLLSGTLEATLETTLDSTQDAELLIGGFVTEWLLQAISEKRGIPQISASLQPYRATRSGAASLMPIVPRGDSLLNRWMGELTSYFVWTVFKTPTQTLRKRLGLKPHNIFSLSRAAADVPTLLGYSPHVVPHPTDWPAHVVTTGYWFLDEHVDYQPPAPLLEFLDAGKPPIYVGFGSMSASDAAARFKLISDALAKAGQRGVIVQGWSGMSAADIPDHVYLLDKVPHDWLFPKMAAVVHHGGAGTTAAGLRAGKPTLIVPHMSDQHYWGRRVYELGVGAKAIPRTKLTVETLAEGLRTMMDDPAVTAKAAALGEGIRAEDGIGTAVEWIEHYIEGMEKK